MGQFHGRSASREGNKAVFFKGEDHHRTPQHDPADHTSTRSRRICGTGPPLTSPGTHETFNATVVGRDQEQEASDIAGDGVIIYSSGYWLDAVSSDALPQRDVHEGLTVAPAQRGALREAEKVFQGLRGSGQTAPAESKPTTAAISSASEVVTPRVLPDLRTAAREAEREDVRQPRRNGAANRSTEGQPRKKASAKPLRVPAAGPLVEPAPALYFSDHAEAAMALRRRMNTSRTKLPPGQRWRERRLPSVCWGRGRRT